MTTLTRPTTTRPTTTRPTTTRPATTQAPARTELVVEREDIRFGQEAPGRVWLEVEVHNRGGRVSDPDVLRVNEAPFGAHVASRPVAKLEVPPVPPGGSVRVGATFDEDGTGRLRPLDAGAGGVTDPASLLDVLSQEAWRRLAMPRPLLAMPRPLDDMAPLQRILARILGRENVAWAGNFDVHIGGCEAERHISSAIRLVSGMENIALFQVGDRAEAFVFDLQGPAGAWEATLSLAGASVPLGVPLDLRPCTWVMLSVSPPAEASQGLLAVGVTRHETGKRALVEFGFGVETIPPGCFRD